MFIVRVPGVAVTVVCLHSFTAMVSWHRAGLQHGVVQHNYLKVHRGDFSYPGPLVRKFYLIFYGANFLVGRALDCTVGVHWH